MASSTRGFRRKLHGSTSARLAETITWDVSGIAGAHLSVRISTRKGPDRGLENPNSFRELHHQSGSPWFAAGRTLDSEEFCFKTFRHCSCWTDLVCCTSFIPLSPLPHGTLPGNWLGQKSRRTKVPQTFRKCEKTDSQFFSGEEAK